VREPVALAALLRDAVERLRWRRPELDWTVDVGEATVHGDESQLTAAVENLLDNQIRYARSRVAVSLRVEAGAAVLRFANDGPELEAATAEGLFQPFRKGKRGQFGLGLSIVQRVAALHGGEVRAVNEPPGAAFYVRLPGSSPGGK
jgi:two-component system sensor histidine kinase CssS